MKAYNKLEQTFQTIGLLQGASAVLQWDSATMMPPGGAKARANQLATLESTCHQLIIQQEISDLLDQAEEETKNLNSWQSANLRLMRHQWKHANALNQDLVEALSRAGTECEMVWRSARPANDFKTFAKHLHEVLFLTREAAQAKATCLNCSPYDALLDQYDPGRKSEEIDTIFTDLETFLPTFIQSVLEQQMSHPAPLPLIGPFPEQKQKELGVTFMKALGFDFDHGRLDVSLHPFCGGVSGDVRITTRYDEHDFTSALMGILHETGHAIYENNLPQEWQGQPVGDALGMTMHESQSLLTEMQVCRSREFLIYAAPIISQVLGDDGAAWEADNLYRLYSRIVPGLIRVDADEATYPAHIILRYRLEKALIGGDMEVQDIPAAWNQSMKELLNVTVPDDKDGCLQDIHWSDGSFGYFPTYTLGAMHAAQFFHAAKSQNPEIVPSIKKGNFAPLFDWLKENIHSQGSRFPTNELLHKVTGKELDTEIYKTYLKNKYLS